jgi:hypothetical protein
MVFQQRLTVDEFSQTNNWPKKATGWKKCWRASLQSKCFVQSFFYKKKFSNLKSSAAAKLCTDNGAGFCSQTEQFVKLEEDTKENKKV